MSPDQEWHNNLRRLVCLLMEAFEDELRYSPVFLGQRFDLATLERDPVTGRMTSRKRDVYKSAA